MKIENAFLLVINAKPGVEIAGYLLRRKGVENGIFVWWVSKDGEPCGCISVPNLVGIALGAAATPGEKGPTAG